MQRQANAVGLFVTIALLVATLYPALFLGQRLAPEAALRSVAPWRLQWGPHPAPAPDALAVATTLGPRLALIAREGVATALWDPYIGGGRPGWLSDADEGGAPLTLVAGLLARPGWAFTALLALEVCAAAGLAFLVFSRLGCSPWSAAAGAIGYALSGAVSAQFLAAPGSALALGPLAFLPALARAPIGPRRIAAWAAVTAALLASGPAAIPFLPAAIAFGVWTARSQRRRMLGTLAIGLALAIVALTPRFVLAAVGREPGAPRAAHAIAPPVRSPGAFFEPAAGRQAPENDGDSDDGSAAEARLGLPLLLLAVVGLVLGKQDGRWAWAAIAAASLAGVTIPGSALAALGLGSRPFGLLALAAAALAAIGADALGRFAPAGAKTLALAVVSVLLIVDLLPATARRLFYAPATQARLESPLAPSATADGSRAAPLLENMPPDVGATLGVPDVRAADLDAEPRYRAVLAETSDRILPVSAVLSPALRRLGARWLVEPLPLRVVSAEIFSAIQAEYVRAPERVGPRLRYRVSVPLGAIRIGLGPSSVAPGPPRLLDRGKARPLQPDATLAGESAAWRWYALPQGWPAGPATLEVGGPASGPPPNLELAWDESDLHLVGETLGARIWRCDGAAPAVSLPPGKGDVMRTTIRAARVEAEVRAGAPTAVRVLVKYRPRLWRARLDGDRVETAVADGVWTAVKVPAGSHRLVLEARLPVLAWALGAAGLVSIAALACVRRSG